MTAGDNTAAAGPPNGGVPAAAPIAAFWAWWPEYAAGADERIGAGGDDARRQVESELAPRAAAVHPELTLELAPATSARNRLVLTCGRARAHRSTTERWLRAAPPADERWEFGAARPPRPDLMDAKLVLHDHDFDLSHLALAARFEQRKARFDVAVYHPDFAFVADETRREVAAIGLERAIGEDEVARWVGAVRIAEEKPIDTITGAGLRAVVGDVAELYTDPTWRTMAGTSEAERPVVVSARFPLRPIDFPLFDQHVTVEVPYKTDGDTGLPRARSLESLTGLERRLVDAAGPDAAMIAHQTGEGVRVLHFYADTETRTECTERIAHAARGWREGDPTVLTHPDPSWEAVRPLLT